MPSTREQIDSHIEHLSEPLKELARQIHDAPELAYQEHEAVRLVTELVKRRGGPQGGVLEQGLELPVGGIDTAFRARLGDGSGPHVAILAEYDALPEIGHACGHNLIAAAAAGAWLALAPLADELGGTIDLIGTPAEEGGGGKIRLIEAGVFEGVEVAMMFHPFDRDLLMHRTLASVWLAMTFRGTPSHAALAPEEGHSALTACMDTFRLIDGQRIHFPDGARVHGFVTDGGQAVNIIPERAACKFSVRANSVAQLDGVREIVERCARAAAMASAVEVEIAREGGYRDMRNNQPLARRFGEHLESLGRRPLEVDRSVGAGSTDMGDVSHCAPAIHPWLAICDSGESVCHQHDFAAMARSERGMTTMLVAAKSMARTAADFLGDPQLRQDARGWFERPA